MHPFEALAEPVRRRIIDVLASGEHTSGQIAEVIGHEYGISRTAVSKHLRVLRDAALVDVRAELRFRWYRLIPEGMEALEEAVSELRKKWDRRIGWDADLAREYDPLGAPPAWAIGRTVPFKGPGRPYRRGRRGIQTSVPYAADPDHGLFRVYPIPDGPPPGGW